MDTKNAERWRGLSRTFTALGVFLPSAPYVLGFPHDERSCFDVRLGSDVCLTASLGLLASAFLIQGVGFRRHTPGERRWGVLKASAVAIAATISWLIGPFLPWPYGYLSR